MSGLRELVEQATGRQLDGHTRTHVLYAPSADLPSCFKGFDNEADATLDALAPELAVLAADMAEWIERVGAAYARGLAGMGSVVATHDVNGADALLSRFRELEGRTGKGAA